MTVRVMQYDSIKLAMIVDIKTNLAYIGYSIIPGQLTSMAILIFNL